MLLKRQDNSSLILWEVLWLYIRVYEAFIWFSVYYARIALLKAGKMDIYEKQKKKVNK